MKVLLAGLFAALLLAAGPVEAEVKMSGEFTASKACPALQSIKKGTNPGNVMVTAGQSYILFAKNNDNASHYFVEVPGAQPARRWVAVDCGTVNGAAQGKVQSQPSEVKIPVEGNLYVLAMSWQPAFCEGKPDKRECRAQTETSFEASHFTLHGLWPQPRRKAYCGVDTAVIDIDSQGRWADLPAIELTPPTRQKLDEVMPGTQSLLERHEWIKHGTCYPGADAEQYFKDAVRVMDEINRSAVRELLASRIGDKVTGTEIRTAFEKSFGAGAGQRVRLACKPDGNRQLLVEITIGLRGNISSGAPVADLIAAASPTDAGCPAGIVDPVGLQ